MLLKWHRDTVRWVERPADAPDRIVLVEGEISLDGLTGWLLPDLAEAFDGGDRITWLTAATPLLAFNATRGEVVRAERWRIWAVAVAPALLLLPVLRLFHAYVDLWALLAAFVVAALLDLELSRVAAKLERDPEGEAALHRAVPAARGRIVITIHDGPEPDWDRRMLDRWNGDFENGYRVDLGPLALPEGRVLVGEPGAAADAIEVAVPPGTHAAWLAIRREDDGIRVSHAFLALRAGTATRVVPVPGADGAPSFLDVDGGLAAFVPPGADASLATASGEHVEPDYLIVKAMLESSAEWVRFAVPGSDDVIVAFQSGGGDGRYPLVRLENDAGAVLAVALDFQLW